MRNLDRIAAGATLVIVGVVVREDHTWLACVMFGLSAHFFVDAGFSLARWMR